MSQGGARPGAGRKRLAPDQKKVGVVICTTPQVKEMARLLRLGGVDLNARCGNLIKELYAWHFKEPIAD